MNAADIDYLGTQIQLTCPLCQSAEVEAWGRSSWNTMRELAGSDVSELMSSEFITYICLRCDLVFKEPLPSVALLNEIYGKSNATRWGCTPDAESCHFLDIEKLARQHSSGRRVLDVGCSNGAMLSTWDRDWRKFGVDYSAAARDIARRRGITVLGSDLGQIPDGEEFDVITMVDVVEHIPDPRHVVDQVFDLLAPRGIVIMLTGDHGYWWWRFVKGKYWYSSLAEHLCFYSAKTFDHIASERHGRVVSSERVSHVKEASTREFLLQSAKNLAFLFVSLAAQLIPVEAEILRRGYPTFTTARDHVLIVISRVLD